MSTTCIDDLAPILAHADPHPEHGALLANDEIAIFYGVSETSIRSLKKRLTDEEAIAEGRHWLTGPNSKTLWTFRGFIRLGMRLTSPMALQLQQHLEDLLAALNAGQIRIVPVEGQAMGVQLVSAGDLLPVSLAQPVSDEAVLAIAARSPLPSSTSARANAPALRPV
ncbi:MAG: hypothetical protein HC771_20265 [Synechococcales cyanobacterium CRU_2_2]|nr:hypothetical protein [Synechococcales cyanobacterium CRU_2_2]